VRPLPEELLRYAGADVYFFDKLFQDMFLSLPDALQEKVLCASTKRLTEYLEVGYGANGRHKAIAPQLA
jgi:hypothetical protein